MWLHLSEDECLARGEHARKEGTFALSRPLIMLTLRTYPSGDRSALDRCPA